MNVDKSQPGQSHRHRPPSPPPIPPPPWLDHETCYKSRGSAALRAWLCLDRPQSTSSETKSQDRRAPGEYWTGPANAPKAQRIRTIGARQQSCLPWRSLQPVYLVSVLGRAKCGLCNLLQQCQGYRHNVLAVCLIRAVSDTMRHKCIAKIAWCCKETKTIVRRITPRILMVKASRLKK